MRFVLNQRLGLLVFESKRGIDAIDPAGVLIHGVTVGFAKSVKLVFGVDPKAHGQSLPDRAVLRVLGEGDHAVGFVLQLAALEEAGQPGSDDAGDDDQQTHHNDQLDQGEGRRASSLSFRLRKSW